MSYPPPPGLKPPSANLPARPPPPAAGPGAFKSSTSNASAKPAFAAFAPRAVASTGPPRPNGPAHYAAQPVTSYSSTPTYSQPAQDVYQAQSYDPSYYSSGAPQIRNPFVPTPGPGGPATPLNASAYPPGYDPDYEAQIQQWQSAYIAKDDSKPGVVKTAVAGPASSGPTVSRVDTPTAETQSTVKRTGGGTEWTDSTLLEWDPAHFRLFIGNLAGEVTDDSLLKAFAKYPSVQKARVIRDKRTTKSKGYGFVSFSDGDDYFQAAKDMQGKYIGSHPVLIKMAKTEVRPTVIKDNRHGKKHNKRKGGGGGANDKVDYGGVSKKLPKTKGGLKVLG